MCALCSVNATTLLTFCVVHHNAALTTFNEDNKEGHCEYEYCNQQQQKEVQVALPRLLDGMANGRRKTRNNTCEDNDRNTVTDTTLSNLFAQPHQEHRS